MAVKASQTAWDGWLAEHGTVTRHVDDLDGRTRDDVIALEPGRHAESHWTPAPVAARATAVVVGRSAIWAEGDLLRADRSGQDEIAWLCWLFEPDPAGRVLRFTDRPLGEGVELCATGVWPMVSARSDGWSLRHSGMPASIEPAAWLIAAWRGRWVRA